MAASGLSGAGLEQKRGRCAVLIQSSRAEPTGMQEPHPPPRNQAILEDWTGWIVDEAEFVPRRSVTRTKMVIFRLSSNKKSFGSHFAEKG